MGHGAPKRHIVARGFDHGAPRRHTVAGGCASNERGDFYPSRAVTVDHRDDEYLKRPPGHVRGRRQRGVVGNICTRLGDTVRLGRDGKVGCRPEAGPGGAPDTLQMPEDTRTGLPSSYTHRPVVAVRFVRKW